MIFIILNKKLIDLKKIDIYNITWILTSCQNI